MNKYYEFPYTASFNNEEEVPTCVNPETMTIRYTSQFPREWATSHLPGTGPECLNCMKYCCWNGVFVGYCGNCAKAYDFTRGYGFGGDTVRTGENAPLDAQTSAGNTYLKDVLLDDIGDASLIGGVKDGGNFFMTIQRKIEEPDYRHLFNLLKHPSVIERWYYFNDRMNDFNKLIDKKPVPIAIWLEWFLKDLSDFSERDHMWKSVRIDKFVI